MKLVNPTLLFSIFTKKKIKNFEIFNGLDYLIFKCLFEKIMVKTNFLE